MQEERACTMVVSTIVQKETPECKGYGSIDGGRKEIIEQVMCYPAFS
jgi:hypothetical protein